MAEGTSSTPSSNAKASLSKTFNATDAAKAGAAYDQYFANLANTLGITNPVASTTPATFVDPVERYKFSNPLEAVAKKVNYVPGYNPIDFESTFRGNLKNVDTPTWFEQPKTDASGNVVQGTQVAPAPVAKPNPQDQANAAAQAAQQAAAAQQAQAEAAKKIRVEQELKNVRGIGKDTMDGMNINTAIKSLLDGVVQYARSGMTPATQTAWGPTAFGAIASAKLSEEAKQYLASQITPDMITNTAKSAGANLSSKQIAMARSYLNELNPYFNK